VHYRPVEARGSEDHSVRPGLHAACAGGHGVVWWDPNKLRLDVEPLGGLRQMELLVDSGSAGAAPEGMREHLEWAERLDGALARGKTPTLGISTVTKVAALGEAPAGEPVRVERTSLPRAGRPRGARFGTLTHAVLAEVALDAERREIEELSTAIGRLVGATEDEVKAAGAAVSAALEHPIMKRAAEAERRGACRREAPVALSTNEGEIVEGAVDLAFRNPDGAWVVVDFKTDAELDLEGPYALQIGLYVRSISALAEPVADALILSV
jgi:hypothetical protein